MGKVSKRAGGKEDAATAKQRRYDLFISEYMIDQNATRAARAAGYSQKSARQQGARLLTNAYISEEIAKRSAAMVEKLGIEAEEVLALNWKKATADVNSVVQVRRGACRFCHGLAHAFQWRTRREFEEHFIRAAVDFWPVEKGENAQARAHEYLQRASEEDLDTPVYPGMPTFEGRAGYRKQADPNPKCPECEGVGLEYVHIPDTRNLQGDGAVLYEGAEQTKDGFVKLKLASRGDALNRVAQIMGLYKQEVDAPAGGVFGSLVEAINGGEIGFTPKAGQLPKNARKQGGDTP